MAGKGHLLKRRLKMGREKKEIGENFFVKINSSRGED